jgi:hypothetical protein
MAAIVCRNVLAFAATNALMKLNNLMVPPRAPRHTPAVFLLG